MSALKQNSNFAQVHKNTPLLEFYSTGKWPTNEQMKVPIKRQTLRIGSPGCASNYLQRSPHQQQDLDIKPITQNKVNSNDYVPRSYLKPSHVFIKQAGIYKGHFSQQSSSTRLPNHMSNEKPRLQSNLEGNKKSQLYASVDLSKMNSMSTSYGSVPQSFQPVKEFASLSKQGPITVNSGGLCSSTSDFERAKSIETSQSPGRYLKEDHHYLSKDKNAFYNTRANFKQPIVQKKNMLHNSVNVSSTERLKNIKESSFDNMQSYSRRKIDYPEQLPDYLRSINDDKMFSSKELAGETGTLQVLSRTLGWMTLTPKKMDKKNPVEKQKKLYGCSDLQTDCSRLAPLWMQDQTKHNYKEGGPQQIKQSAIMTKQHLEQKKHMFPVVSVRQEESRVQLRDLQQPERSMWNTGDMRHDEHLDSMAVADRNQAIFEGSVRFNNGQRVNQLPSRFLDWPQTAVSKSYLSTTLKSPYAQKKITGKV